MPTTPIPWIPDRIDLLDLSLVAADPIPVRGIVGGNGRDFVAQVTVDEDASDDLIITEHPVEGRATINDHAFKRPAEVRVRIGWSNAFAVYTGYSDVRQIYEQILLMQASRLPCTIYTGKRAYDNMLLASLRTHTDASLEWSFIADCTFREVILVNTSAWGIGAVEYNQGALASPDTNTQSIRTGLLQLIPKSVPYNTGPDVPSDLFTLPASGPG